MYSSNIKYILIIWLVFSSYSFSFVVSIANLLDDVYRASCVASKVSKNEFTQLLQTSPYTIKSFSALPQYSRMRLYMGISKIPKTKHTHYLNKFNQLELEDGDRILINAIKNNKNLDEVWINASKASQIQRRRITNIEKELINSQGATKVLTHGRTVVKRNIFECSQDNISLMLRGRAPFGDDGKRINLHHLKQQKNGSLVELTETEHNTYSKVLHRYVKSGSEITDRNGGFMSFRQKYWKSRAVGCRARGK
ncbi:MAG: HNH/ENDO VII family nuclease [Bacteroidales bacterium]|nr:HNH/ENDO VII family nuclease [Bacteroidales bacterium]